MAYSKIKEVELFNFMSFSHARIVFDETNILNLKGYNDSGKSAVLRAIMVCLADMFKKAQVKYIRYGAEYFRVVVSFDDGVSILRDKYLNGQSLYEMHKGGKVIYTTKQGSRLTRVEGVPGTIQNYLGLCVTDSGCLNYQSCSDRLLLVETTGSENYAELNSVLKSEELSRATALINSDRNSMNSKRIELENEYDESKAVLKSRSDVTEEVISLLEEREAYSDKLLERQSDSKELYDLITSLNDIPLIPDISRIESGRLEDIETLFLLLKEESSLPQIPEVQPLQVERISAISNISSLIKSLEGLKSIPVVDTVDSSRLEDIGNLLGEFDRLKHLPELPPMVQRVDIQKLNRLDALSKISSDISRYSDCIREKNELNAKEEAVNKKISSVLLKAEELGVGFYKCPNCGTYVEVNKGHAHKNM